MQKDILSYVEFYKYPDFIKGKFYHLDRDSIDHRFNYMDIPEIVAFHPDKKEQIFFQYDLENKSGYYLYPCNKDKEIKILLKNLAIFDKILELRPMIDYSKKLKTIHSIASFMKWENYLDNQISITGDQLEPFIRTKETLSISEYFIKTLRTRTKRHSDKANQILTELALYNHTILKNEEAKLSRLTQEFLDKTMNNVIDKGVQKQQYDFLISEFENNLSKTLSEKEWQNFIFDNFRLLFPEFIKIDKEKKLTTIDQDTKYIDFILQNDSTELLLEIKLPSAKIMSDSKDRNNHYLVSGVTKAILQLQRYITSYRAEIFKTNKEIYLKALLLIGEDKNTDIKQNNDWNLARNMYKDIDIITYTELLKKIRNIRDILK